jgi:hypothetical protein
MIVRRSRSPRRKTVLLVSAANLLILLLHMHLNLFLPSSPEPWNEEITRTRNHLREPPKDDSAKEKKHSRCSADLTNRHILLLDVHLEGNLGDLQETLPVLQHLKEDCGANITAVLSDWKPVMEDKLHSRTIGAQKYIDQFQTFSIAATTPKSCTTVVVAPGPWKICELFRKWPHKIDVFLGGSFMKDPMCKSEDESEESNAWKRVQSSQLVVVREVESYAIAQEKQISRSNLFLGADFSYSLQVQNASQVYWKNYYDHYKDMYLLGRTNARETHDADSATKAPRSVIFSRNNNFGRGARISQDKVKLKLSSKRTSVTLPLHDVIFATSSDIEDADHFEFLKKTYRLHDAQMIQCQSIEQLFGLLSSSLVDHVYTDRYHPGVASHIVWKPFTVLDYPAEQIKLTGLAELTEKQSPTYLKTLNQQAFQMLDKVVLANNNP